MTVSPPATSSTLVVHSDSVEFVRVKVRLKESGEFVDPTSFTVELAFPLEAKDPSSWLGASWETGEADGPPYVAQVKVGPGEQALDPGRYGIWIKVAGTDETPVRRVGTLEVL